MSHAITPAASTACAETRQRLLDAASEVFAECGFHSATVREICSRAGANIAAINYHFGDKEQLYLEVLRQGAREANKRYPLTGPGGPAEGATPQKRLHAFIHMLLKRIFDLDRMATHGMLMAREMIDPTPALDVLIEETIRPTSVVLTGIVRDLLGPEATEPEVRMCNGSIIGQCVYYKHCRPMLERLYPDQRLEPEDIEELAEHITQFTLNALRGLARKGKKHGEEK